MEQIRKRSTDTRNVTENVKPVSNNRTLSQEYCYKLIDVVAVVVIITVLWLLMAIPTVAYAYHVATLEASCNQCLPTKILCIILVL